MRVGPDRLRISSLSPLILRRSTCVKGRFDRRIWRYIAVAAVLGFAAQGRAGELTLRLGQGGFRDGRAPDGKLGGGQLFLDMRFGSLPLAVSLGSEYYTKGPDPSQPYEISDLLMGTVCFLTPLVQRWPTNLYLGAGIGRLSIPQGEHAAVFQAIARIDTKVVWKVGLYAEGKYLHSRKDLIDFNELALLLGIYLRFAW
jgi:hypothetical protein